MKNLPSGATSTNSSGIRPAAALPDRSSSSSIASAMDSSCGPLHFDPALPRSSKSSDEFMKMAPIGMFDSGIGGLMLFSQIERLFPNETIYYLADTAHFPYGEKSPSEIINYSLQNAAFLLEQNVKALVIACFTASALAYEALKSYTDIPVISVVDSLLEELKKHKNCSRAAILGTRATINSGVIQNRLPGMTLFPIACTDLIFAIEKRDEVASRALLQHYNAYFRQHQIDTVLLACTHFAHILPLMTECFSKEITIVEASGAAAEKIASIGLSGSKHPHKLFATGTLPSAAFQPAPLMAKSHQ